MRLCSPLHVRVLGTVTSLSWRITTRAEQCWSRWEARRCGRERAVSGRRVGGLVGLRGNAGQEAVEPGLETEFVLLGVQQTGGAESG